MSWSPGYTAPGSWHVGSSVLTMCSCRACSFSVGVTGPLQGCFDLTIREAPWFLKALDYIQLKAKTLSSSSFSRALLPLQGIPGYRWPWCWPHGTSWALSYHNTKKKDPVFPKRVTCNTERCPGFWIASASPFSGVTVHENWSWRNKQSCGTEAKLNSGSCRVIQRLLSSMPSARYYLLILLVLTAKMKTRAHFYYPVSSHALHRALVEVANWSCFSHIRLDLRLPGASLRVACCPHLFSQLLFFS